MGEKAKPFWVKEEEVVSVDMMAFEDIAELSTGENDDAWKFGSD